MELTKRCVAEISLDNIRRNYEVIRGRVTPEAKLMAVVKADAYGHGALVLSREYERLGADRFAVSNINEAIELREGGIAKPILILGYTPPEYAVYLKKYEITQSVFSSEYAAALEGYAEKENITLEAHLKIDTGMSRIGLFYHDIRRDAAAVDEAEKICTSRHLSFEGIFTHFALADAKEAGEKATRTQFGLFTDMIDRLGSRGISFPTRHCANSAAIIDYPEYALDMVRPGIILYGLSPSPEMVGDIDIIPAMTLKTLVSEVKEIPSGTQVSYGGTYTSAGSVRLATVPVGYADGYPRLLSSRADMSVNGQRAKITGRVCMDQLMLNVTGIHGVEAGTKVECFGDGKNGGVTADELAALTNTINYEITCDISKRVPRIYIPEEYKDERLQI